MPLPEVSALARSFRAPKTLPEEFRNSWLPATLVCRDWPSATCTLVTSEFPLYCTPEGELASCAKGGGADVGAAEDIHALVGGVGQAQHLLLQTLHLLGQRLAVGGGHGAVGPLRAHGNGRGEDLSGVVQRRIGRLQLALHVADVGQELIVFAGERVVAHQRRGGGGIVGKIVDAASGGHFLHGGLLVLLGLLDGGQQVRQDVGIQAHAH